MWGERGEGGFSIKFNLNSLFFNKHFFCFQESTISIQQSLNTTNQILEQLSLLSSSLTDSGLSQLLPIQIQDQLSYYQYRFRISSATPNIDSGLAQLLPNRFRTSSATPNIDSGLAQLVPIQNQGQLFYSQYRFRAIYATPNIGSGLALLLPIQIQDQLSYSQYRFSANSAIPNIDLYWVLIRVSNESGFYLRAITSPCAQVNLNARNSVIIACK